MIISFDGNVFTGKTTIILNLSLKYGFNKISEYNKVLNDIPIFDCYDNEYKNIQKRYFEIDKKRILNLNDGVNLVDRSFVSMSAHVYALYKMNLIDIRSFYVNELKCYLERGNIIVPDKYVFVTCSYETASERYELDNGAKGTEKKYINNEYFNYIDEFNIMWSIKNHSLILDTEDMINYDLIYKFIYKNDFNAEEKGRHRILAITEELFDNFKLQIDLLTN